MKLCIISFTKKGIRLSESIAKLLKKDAGEQDSRIETVLYTKCRASMEESVSASFVEASTGEWAGEQMKERNALLFIGACGIAVRAIAPFLTDKLHDVPVLVMDENAKYIIPILSGHMGGANELANKLAKKTGAEPVITTATDCNRQFAVDLFAKRNALFIVNKEGIAKVSSKVLAGREITIAIEPGHGEVRKAKNDKTGEGGIRPVPYPPEETADIVITSEEKRFDTAILLKPREYVIGMGCKRGKNTEEITDFIAGKLEEAGITESQIYALSSIEQKSGEQGLIKWCQKAGVPFLTYTAADLQGVEGNFEESCFVKEQVGIGNVCERAAIKACGEGAVLMIPKSAENGMTIAIAKREWKVDFYEE